MLFNIFDIIRIYKSTNLGVIVSTLEIIELCLGIVIIASISERVDRSNINIADIACNCTLSPCVVGVAGYNCSCVIGNCYYVTLQVLIEIICSAVVLKSANCSVEVVQIFVDILRTVTNIGDCFFDYIRSVKRIFVNCILGLLFDTNTVFVVPIFIYSKCFELSALFPFK